MDINRRKFIKMGTGTTLQVLLISIASKAGLSAPFSTMQTQHAGENQLLKDFLAPPDAYKSSCYWWWFNGLVDEEGITRDLEAYREKGMGAVLLVNSSGGLGGASFPQGTVFMSEAWKTLYRHAMKEAKRLHIDVGINLSSGWCMGGPWIDPPHAGRWYLQSTLTLEGPKRFSGKLPLPGGRSGYDKVFNPPGYKAYIDLPLEVLDYRDSSVVAIFHPKGAGNIKISGDRTKTLDAKTNHRDASNFARANQIMDPTRLQWNNETEDSPAPIKSVIDLSDKLRPDGSLDWEVPDGHWTIVRTGHRMTGSRLMIAQSEADGLSVDWFDRRGVQLQFENLGMLFIEEAAKVGNKPAYFCDDSFEDGFPNWTPDILNKFRRYRGYDPTPYLPVLSGFIMESAEISDRFLHDYRKTLGDAMADEHYGTFAKLCHDHGIKVQNESAGPSRSGTMCMDGLKNLGRSDFPMGEFWLGPHHEDQSTLTDDKSYGVSRLDLGQNKVTKMVASAAHLYGRQTASAEAFTSFRHWQDAPGMLKQALDRAYCEGINRIAIHTSTATRPRDGKPGYEYGAGTHFNPNVTWWEKSEAFFDYVSRCQCLLQAGKFVADVLFYNGDGAPNLVAQKHTDPSLGPGYDYDVCNEEVLLDRLAVRDGRIVLPDGMRYEVLVLPEHNTRMPLPVLEKIAALVEAGAWVVGSRPKADAGLKGYPECDQAIRQLAAKLWGQEDADFTRIKSDHRNGQIIAGKTVRFVLQKKGIEPDFQYYPPKDQKMAYRPDKDALWIDFIHRRLPEAEIYFLTNRLKKPAEATCRFRIQNRVP
ncbi:MAG TPA: glycosyl hydrolase, partial [Arachidicoccus sp.]|nr:glycosyl hydrolase [Arachidicoccus sp.]